MVELPYTDPKTMRRNKGEVVTRPLLEICYKSCVPDGSLLRRNDTRSGRLDPRVRKD